MSDFLMPVSRDVQELLDDIVAEMVTMFGVSRAEAVARINALWQSFDLSGDDEIILHEDAYYWALVIYYGKPLPDWGRDADRSTWTPNPKPDRSSGCWTVEE